MDIWIDLCRVVCRKIGKKFRWMVSSGSFDFTYLCCNFIVYVG